MAGESYTTKKILLKAVDGTTTQYFIPYVNNATADKTGLVKPDGTTITVDANGTISAQVDISGLQPKIDADHKLSADLISDGTTNKVVTATEKSTWNGKQNAISDLSTIRSNAEAGAGAASTIAGYGDIVTHDADEFLTEHQDISGKQDKIDSTHKLSADLLSEGTTNKLVSASEKSTWSGKQDAISDLSTIRSNATAGAGAATTIAGYGDVVTHDADEFAEASHTHTKSQITDFPTIPTVNDAEIEIQKNGTKVASFTTNQGGSKKTINITVPTSAADVSALPASTKYGSTIDLAVDPDTYVVTATLKDQDGTALSSDTIDLPLESVVVSGSYDSTNKKVVLTLQSGSTIEFSVADLISGLQTEITSTNKLSADLVKDGTTNKVVTATEKSTWNGKQNAISDLSTIRSNAEAGAGAASTIAGYGDIVTHDASEFLTEHQDISGKQDKIDSTHKLSSDLVDDTNKTHKFVTATEKSTWNGKQDAISDLSTIRTNATAGAGAATTIAGYGDIVTHDADEFAEASHSHAISDVTNLQTTLNGKQATIDSSHKLSADLISDGTTNKTVTATEKSTWNGKQNAISDLSTIRSNAEAGAGAASTIAGYGDIVTHDADEFLTEHQDISGKANTADLGAAAFSNSYNDLDNKPTIPTVNNATLTIQKNGTTVKTFTANASSNVTCNITVPTAAADIGAATSDHTHSNYVPTSRTINSKALTGNITLSASDVGALPDSTAIPSKTSDLTNDSGFITGVAWGDVTGKPTTFTPSSHNQASSTINALTSYSKSVSGGTGALSTSDTLNKALAKLENALDGKQGTVSDISTIRSNAEAGAGAATTIAGYGDIVTHNASEFAGASHTHSNYVPTSRTINSKALTDNISLTASDVGAAASSHTHTKSQITDFPTIPTITDTYSATSSNGMSGKAVASAISGKANSATSLSGYGITDAYTKTEIDGMVSAGMHYKGSKTSYSNLPTTGNQTGDLWNVTDTGANYAWNGTGWDKMSENIDLSGYVPTSRTINSKALTGNISLTASDVGAATSDHTHSNYVPTSRTINSKALTGNITLSASDVGALPDSTSIPSKTSDLTNDSGFITGVAWGDVTGKPSTFAPSSHNQASSTINALTNYSKSVSGGTGALATSDTLNKALAKLENALDGKQASGSYAAASHTHTKSEITDFPTIPTITDTYSSTSSNGMSGKAVASAISGVTCSSIGAATSDHTHSGYVPTSRTINSKALSANITLTASDVGAAASDHTHSGYVPTSRTINSKALTGNITLSASDVGALPDSTTIPSKTSDLTNDSGFITSYTDTKNTAGTTNKTGTKMFLAAATSQGANPQTFSNSGCYIGTDDCLYSNGTKVLTAHQSLSGYVPTSRTVNGKALSANISLSASDVGALPDSTAIPTKVSDLTNDAGYTTNTGTITGIKMNGSSKGTSGVVDLGTVITSQYVHPTTAGNKHIPSGGSSGQILKWSSDGTATWAAEYSYTHPTTAGNKHVPSGGSSNQVLVYGGSSGTASWGAVPSHNQASSTINVMTSYTKASAAAAIAATDSLNTAVGKLEYKIDDVDTQLQALTAMLNNAS